MGSGESGAGTVRAGSRFLLCTALVLCKREKLLASGTGANFKISHAFVVDVGRQQELNGVVAEQSAILEFYGGQSLIEHFEGRFLAFALGDVPKDEDRLPFPFGAQVPQGSLGRRRTGEVPG